MTLLTDLAHNLAEILSYTPGSPMLFSSGLFWGLFLLFLPLYSWLRDRRRQMIVFVVLFSFYFYYRCSGSLVNLTQAGVITEKGASVGEMPPQDPAVRHFLN